MPLSAFTNTFAGNPLDRASERRTDAAWLAEKLAAPGSLAVALWNGRPLVEDGKGSSVQLAWLAAGMARTLVGSPEHLLFLGLWKEAAIFALDLEGDADPADGALESLGRFDELWAVAPALPAADAAITATARSMFEWRRRHRHCATCGGIAKIADGGWKLICAVCRAEHFPRTDPVVIMLAVREDQCLLGRQSAWPAGMFSALAGFLEPGESIEEACARELFEEARLRARRVRYHSTQPWPYPSSLMIGLIASVEEGEAAADGIEIDEVRWFAREKARPLIAGDLIGLKAPPALAIAHQLIKAWSQEGFEP